MQPANAGTSLVEGTLGGHGYFYPPVLLPDFGVTDQKGKHAKFRQILRGRISLVQLIFTTCSNVCPIQGATFSQLQNMIPAAWRSQVQLLSMTIDPFNDDPGALANWLKQFQPQAMWKALRPDLNDIDLVRQLLNQNRSEVNSHLSEVLLIDVSARLVWRSSELPSSEALADKLFALLKKN
ncbi:SCO family protein [Undibacterium sp. Ji67W]|uniref:SCO family protein n=1 Tax=Undibacterium sp. Ji67W TaxID=3413042 RepID=UPI003BF2FB23